VGDLVLRKEYVKKNKLTPNFKGKVWKVMMAFQNGSYVIVDDKGKTARRKVNGATLRLYSRRG
ncbi:hypothetical protein CLU79DRAFT_710147, partial [Phycomyces nitens]